MRDEGVSDMEVPEVIEVSVDTVSESWNKEDSNCSMSFVEHEDMVDDCEVTKMENVIMQSEVWKELPCELHAHIFHFCSVLQLCRLRIVCREWNNLTHKLGFTLKFQPQHTYIFKAPRFIDGTYSINYWATVDTIEQIREEENCNNTIIYLLRNKSDLFYPTTEKSYPISMEFMYDGLRSRYTLLDWCQIMAAHKSFVWVLWSTNYTRLMALMQVVNPVTRSVVEIPPIRIETSSFKYARGGAMTVADDYSPFTLYIFFEVGDSHVSNLAQFDSHVSKWRKLPGLPETLEPSNRVQIVNGTLYTMFRDSHTYRYHHFFALDTMRDTWTDMGLEQPYNEYVSKLATALGRLFYVQLFYHDHDYVEGIISIEIVEIDIASGKCWTIATMDKATHGDLLKFHSCSLERYQVGANTAVVGCGEFIVITSVIGKSIAYDLLKNELREWSFGRSIVDLKDTKKGEHYGIFGVLMTLTLNPVPWAGAATTLS